MIATWYGIVSLMLILGEVESCCVERRQMRDGDSFKICLASILSVEKRSKQLALRDQVGCFLPFSCQVSRKFTEDKG